MHLTSGRMSSVKLPSINHSYGSSDMTDHPVKRLGIYAGSEASELDLLQICLLKACMELLVNLAMGFLALEVCFATVETPVSNRLE